MPPSRLIPITVALTSFGTACRSAPNVTAAPEAPVPAVFTYRPAQGTYLAVSRRHLEQDLEGGTQESETVVRFRLHTDVIPADSGFHVTFTVDSVLDVTLPGASPSEARRLEGRRFTSEARLTGELVDFDPGPSTSRLAQHMTDIIGQFFPRIPFDGVQEGTVWTDSIAGLGPSGGAEITTTAVIENRAEAWTQFLGQDALVVSWTSSYRFSGAGEQLGQSFTIEGAGERVGHHYLSRDGLLLGSISTDSSVAAAEVATIGITIPIRQRGADSILIQVQP